jgi:acyl-CoA synthetase (NDP forming)
LRQKGNLRQGKIGCDDYTDNVGIVSQLGKMGYLASLTLNDIKVELEDIALFFAVK